MYHLNYSDKSCTFKNNTCKVESRKVFFDESEYEFQLKNKNQFAEFGFYNNSIGLVKLRSNNPIKNDNILLNFISIDTENERHAVKQLCSFFKEYGFLFKIPKNCYEEIVFSDIRNLLNRLTTTVKLFNELQTNNNNYEMIMVYLLKLISSKPFTIHTKYSTYRSYTHEITSVLYSKRVSALYDSLKVEEKKEPDRTNSDQHESIQDNDSEEDNAFPNEAIQYNDPENYSVFPIIESQIVDCVSRAKDFQDPFFDEISGEKDSKRSGIDDKLLKSIAYAYNRENEYSDHTLKLLSLLYYYYEDVGIIKSFSDNGIKFYDDDQVHKENFTDYDKQTLLELAHELLANEINYNLRGIKVVYNPVLRVNEIHIETLLEALYYSLSFFNPDLVIYKRCPTCLSFFEVSSTNSRKKYCSPECQNNRKDKRK